MNRDIEILDIKGPVGIRDGVAVVENKTSATMTVSASVTYLIR